MAASPVLIGATTVLIALVAVFIAYNANSGLPFVPTYDLKAELPSGDKLVKGNEVRVGGFRVGVVKELRPEVRMVDGERRAVAVERREEVLELKRLGSLLYRVRVARRVCGLARPRLELDVL